jgi:monoamine oxidase
VRYASDPSNKESALRRLPQPKAVSPARRAFLGGVETVFPGGIAKWNARAASSLPALDPNLGASYSYWRVGQYTAFAGYEKARQGDIFFAGEHCSADYQGFMEGGASEGARAAKEILDQLRGKKAT